MRTRIGFVIVGLVVIGFVAYWLTRQPSAPRAVCRAVREANRAIVYEGLPHPLMENEVYASERKATPVQTLDGHLFYTPSQTVRDEDVDQLVAILSDERTYRAFGGVKKCGGFHPDFAVEFHSGNERYLIFLCFGCHEVRAMGPGFSSLHDFTKDAQWKLLEILRSYRDKRPDSNYTKSRL